MTQTWRDVCSWLGVVRRPQVWKFGEQITVRPNLLPVTLPQQCRYAKGISPIIAERLSPNRMPSTRRCATAAMGEVETPRGAA